MPRLRNSTTGAVVNVSDDTAGRLSREWQPVTDGKAEPKKTTPSRRRKSD